MSLFKITSKQGIFGGVLRQFLPIFTYNFQKGVALNRAYFSKTEPKELETAERSPFWVLLPSFASAA